MLPNSCIETILIEKNKASLMALHNERFYTTIKTILPDYDFEDKMLENAIEPYLQESPIILSCQWNAKHPNLILVQPRDFLPLDIPYKLLVDSSIIQSKNKYNWIKSGDRDFYNLSLEKAKEQNCNDALIFNQDGKIVESCIANIIVEKAGNFYTPPIEDGCVTGVYRQFIINNEIAKIDKLITQSLTLDDLKTANKIYLCNAVRGLFEVALSFHYL